MPPVPPGTDWHAHVVKVVDGDTVRVFRTRTVHLADGLLCHLEDDPATYPTGLPVRLINVDTPERGQPGHAEAAADLAVWLAGAGDELRVTTWGTTGGFDRLLGDLWYGDRGNTASQYLLRDCGWKPYVDGV